MRQWAAGGVGTRNSQVSPYDALDFLFDLVESISIEVDTRFDEVCRISYKLDELAETALQACFVASLRPARHGQWAQPLPSDHLDPRDPAAADWIRALPPDP